MKDPPELIELRFSIRDVAGNLVVSPEGDCDIATAPALRSCLCKLLNRWQRPVVVDLSGLTYIDSSGLGTLIAAYRRATQLGCAFSLAAPTARTAKLLAVTGIDTLVPIFATVTDACSAHRPTHLDVDRTSHGQLRSAARVETYLHRAFPPSDPAA